MSKEILTRDGGYIQLFTSKIEIDKNLPKWCIIESSKASNEVLSDKDREQILENARQGKITTKSNSVKTSYSMDFDSDTPEMDLGTYLNLNSFDFNIYLGQTIRSKLQNNGFSENNFRIDINSNERKPKFIVFVEKVYKKFFDSKKDSKKEVEPMFNALKFFEMVKLTCKESQEKYAKRLEPYLKLLSDAKKMGQQALVDQISQEIINFKFESILYAENFNKKITEEQVVDFVKKAEKGIRLDYIKYFSRPIPENIIKLKEKADNLFVFDNYVVMHYDPEKKSYKQTQEEIEKERQKKADPILFGVISGINALYYIGDWIDEYCDLTLNEFIKVSELSEKDIEITEKFSLGNSK